MPNKPENESYLGRSFAPADYAYWSKAAYWKLDEAIALSFGKDPEGPNSEVSLLQYDFDAEPTPFMKQYFKIRDLILRAKECGHLTDPILPTAFVAWVRHNDIDFPTELAAQVEARSGAIPDWKAKYQQIRKEFDDLKASTQKEKTLKTRERETLLKMLIGMAKGGYGYDHKATKSLTIGEIEKDLEGFDVKVSDDTIRKWLKEAAAFLPPQDADL